jgi:NAD(P)-dependent dehydrogenase (short-subunit alcohol dehydrogenase family)
VSLVLVTGGTHGIGRAVVERLRHDGTEVVFTGRDQDAGEAVAGATGATFVACDVRDTAALEGAVADAVGRGGGLLDGLVNNAGVSRRGAFADTGDADYALTFEVNVRGAYVATRAALPALRAARGAVVMLASVAGVAGEEGLSLYSASKASLIAMAQSIALEIGDEVRCNAVCPGQIRTRMMDRVVSDASALRDTVARIPAGRLGTPEDVAAAVTWLLSPESGFVNGTTLVVDGGESAGIRAPRPPL